MVTKFSCVLTSDHSVSRMLRGVERVSRVSATCNEYAACAAAVLNGLVWQCPWGLMLLVNLTLVCVSERSGLKGRPTSQGAL